MDIKKAIILAGGLGTRLRPLTNSVPKPLLHVNGKPIIQYAIDNLVKYGVKEIILSVGFRHEKIQEFFGDGSKFGCKISYCIEKEPLGTGGAVKLASKGITQTFIVLNGDNIADFNYSEMWKVHSQKKSKITLALFPVEDVTQYGIAQLSGEKIIRFIEKPSVDEAPSNLNNAGCYMVEPHVLDMLPDGVCSIERDCFEKIAKEGCLFAYIHKGQWYPTDNIEKYILAHNYKE